MGASLTIRKLTAAFTIVGSSEGANATVDRAATSLRASVTAAIDRILAPYLDPRDDSVWVVRCFDLALVNSEISQVDALSGGIATALIRAFGKVLVGDGDAVNAIRFADRASYLASFVVDAAAGDAWSKWYYEPLLGLRALPSSAAIRTALSRDPSIGIAALQSLDDNSLARVVAALTRDDESRLLDAMTTAIVSAGVSTETSSSEWTACARSWIEQRTRQRAAARGGNSATAATAGHQDAADGETRTKAFDAAWPGFTRAHRTGDASWRALFAFIRGRDRYPAAELASAARALAAVASETGEAGAKLKEAINSESASLASSNPALNSTYVRSSDSRSEHLAGTGDPESALGHASGWTRFGGHFLLLRGLDEIPWTTITADWPAPRCSTPPMVVKWAVLAMCAGPTRAAAFLDDRIWRALLGISADYRVTDAGRWLQDIGRRHRASLGRATGELRAARPDRAWFSLPHDCGIPAAWRGKLSRLAEFAMRRFAARLPGFANSGPEHLWRNFLDFDAVLEADEDRVVVRCGQPALHLVLTLTGMTRGSHAGADAFTRPLMLFPRE